MNVKKFFTVLLVLLLGIVAVVGGVGMAWYTTSPFSAGEHGNALSSIGDDGIVNFLLVGQDHVGENTDVLMVLSVNSKTEKISILSIPRDTRVHVGGSNRKINSVYSYAGYKGLKKEELLIKTVSQVSGLPIHYFAIINLQAFEDIVDELGGVEFNVKRAYHYDDPLQDLHIHLEPGLQVLNGHDAEGLVRYRHDYAMGDIERVAVQQEFIQAMIEQKLRLKYLPKVSEVYDKVTDNVISNLRVTDIVSYAGSILKYETNTYMLPGTTKAEAAFWYPNDDETKALIAEEFGYSAEK
ncbi:MAG: LCP family protein [Clostridia bacterium]|nr:LCP family protein [Clostridia bacterium]